MVTRKWTLGVLFINSNTQISPSSNSLSTANLFQPPFSSVRRRVNAHRTPHHTFQIRPSPTSSFTSTDSFIYLSEKILGKLCRLINHTFINDDYSQITHSSIQVLLLFCSVLTRQFPVWMYEGLIVTMNEGFFVLHLNELALLTTTNWFSVNTCCVFRGFIGLIDSGLDLPSSLSLYSEIGKCSSNYSTDCWNSNESLEKLSGKINLMLCN